MFFRGFYPQPNPIMEYPCHGCNNNSELVEDITKEIKNFRVRNERKRETSDKWGPLRQTLRDVGEIENAIARPSGFEAKIKDEDEEIIKAIKAVYDDEYKKVQDEPNVWPPDSENLTLALEVWLKSFEGFEFQNSEVKNNMKIKGKYNGRDFEFFIFTGRVHSGAIAGLNRGINFLNENRNAFCCYVSEKKIHKPTWKKVQEIMKIFKDSGGNVLMLDAKTRVRWYALTALINRVDNGDVNLYLPSGERTATRGDIKKFAQKNIILLDFPFNNDDKKKTEKPDKDKDDKNFSLNINDALVFNIVSEMLDASPMKMLSVKRTCELLAQRSIEIAEKKLISLLKRDKTFKIYKNDDDDPIITFSGKR